jgi:hypothetical protein
VPDPSSVDDEKLITAKGPYVPLRSLGLTNAFPVLQGYKDSVGIGYRFNIQDPLALARLGITASYSPSTDLPPDQRGHVDIAGSYLSWRTALSWNHSDFYDLFGPTKRSRKGYAAKIGYDWGLIYDEPRRLSISFDLAYYDKIDTLPDAQNVATNFSRLVTGQVGIHYTDVQRSIGAVDDEKGVNWALVYDGNSARGEFTPQLRGSLDFGVPLPSPYSSIWLRSAAGVGNGDRDNVVANYYFGKFGNNYLDDNSVKRYRDYDSLPGFGIDAISALNFVREMAEWNLPPYAFESAGTPALYLSSLQPSLFAGGLWADPGNASRRKNYASVGVQADLRLNVLHWNDMTLSFGCAEGFRDGRHAGTEWMVSLKIM